MIWKLILPLSDDIILFKPIAVSISILSQLKKKCDTCDYFSETRYIYLGVLMDWWLSWNTHVDNLSRRPQLWLRFWCRLRVHSIVKTFIFCQAVLESQFRYSITVWFGYLPVQLKSNLMLLIQTAWKITVCENPTSLQAIFEQATLKQAYSAYMWPIPCSTHRACTAALWQGVQSSPL